MDALPRLTMARSASCGEPLASPVLLGSVWRQADGGHTLKRFVARSRSVAHLGASIVTSTASGDGGTMGTVSVRYIVDHVDAAIAFYRDRLGFAELMHPAPTFAALILGDLRLLLSQPSSAGGGGQAMPDGTQPTPGGWNRISLEVTDLDGRVTSLRAAGAHFRNEIVTGVGGRQILVDDPSGNPVELFEPYAQ